MSMLDIRGVKKSFGGVEILKGVDLTVEKGDVVAILGPSGSGKTTFLNVVGGLDKYDSGDLVINGRSTKEFSDADWDAPAAISASRCAASRAARAALSESVFTWASPW